MPDVCYIPNCNSRWGRNSVSFFRLPKVITHQGEATLERSNVRRLLWLEAINRKDMKNYDNVRVCSVHFVSGKPSTLYEENSPDWVPSLKLGRDDQSQTKTMKGKGRSEAPSKESSPQAEVDSSNFCPERITGALVCKGNLMFVMKWKDQEGLELITSQLANKKYPQTVIAFYEERLTWDNANGVKVALN